MRYSIWRALAFATVACVPTLSQALDIADFSGSTSDAAIQLQEALISDVAGGNIAVIVQNGSANVAYIDQSTSNDNRAMISQTGDGHMASIQQAGSGNLAVITTR